MSAEMKRACGLILIALAACGATQSPSTAGDESVQAIPYSDLRAGAVCDAGNWIPQAQEPAEYVTCAADAECVKMSMPGCCSETQVAIRRDRACGTDLGSECDMECGDSARVRPAGAESQRAVCVAHRCTLR